MQDYKNLKVWERAHQLTLAVYQATSIFPKDEMYGLTSQIRRACASVPANIAEGCGRDGDAEFARFLRIAMGSASELDYHLLLARDLKLLNATTYLQLENGLSEVRKMLNTFLQRLKADR